jgi:hypothetical protein
MVPRGRGMRAVACSGLLECDLYSALSIETRDASHMTSGCQERSEHHVRIVACLDSGLCCTVYLRSRALRFEYVGSKIWFVKIKQDPVTFTPKTQTQVVREQESRLPLVVILDILTRLGV